MSLSRKNRLRAASAGAGHNTDFLAALSRHPRRPYKIAAPKLDSFCHSRARRMNLRHPVAAIMCSSDVCVRAAQTSVKDVLSPVDAARSLYWRRKDTGNHILQARIYENSGFLELVCNTVLYGSNQNQLFPHKSRPAVSVRHSLRFIKILRKCY